MDLLSVIDPNDRGRTFAELSGLDGEAGFSAEDLRLLATKDGEASNVTTAGRNKVKKDISNTFQNFHTAINGNDTFDLNSEAGKGAAAYFEENGAASFSEVLNFRHDLTQDILDNPAGANQIQFDYLNLTSLLLSSFTNIAALDGQSNVSMSDLERTAGRTGNTSKLDRGDTNQVNREAQVLRFPQFFNFFR